MNLCLTAPTDFGPDQAALGRRFADQAIGIVMAQNRCSSPQAFDALRRASQNRNTKIRVLATDIRPESQAPAMLRCRRHLEPAASARRAV